MARRVALYGGSFDPVHLGHTAVARNLLELFTLDEVLFIPAHVAPHKRDRRVSPALHRFAMLALATQGEPRLRLSTVELEAPERPYTVETLAHFVEREGDGSRLFLVMGADSWEEITTWREWERVLSLASTLVVTRPGHELPTGHVTREVRGRVVDVRGAGREEVERALSPGGARIFFTDAAVVPVSSTEIRRSVNESGGAADLSGTVAPAVAEYIRKHGLYREVHGTGRDEDGEEEGPRGQEGRGGGD